MAEITAAFYNKENGYYITNNSSSKIEEQQQEQDENGQLIAIPWDNDSFSLCLDTFPASRLARTKYNINPMVASPLRKYWRSSSLSDSEEGEEEERESNISTSSESNHNQAVPANDTTSTDAVVMGGDQEVIMTRKKKKANKTEKTILQIDTAVMPNSNFPYNNNSTFLNQMGVEQQQQYQPNIISSTTNSSIKTGRVEHISPFLNSSLLLQTEQDFQSLISKQSSIRSSSSSMISVPAHLRGGSIYTDSQISEIPGWRVASVKRRNALRPMIDQFPSPPPNVVTAAPTLPLHLEYYPSSRSGSVASSHHSYYSQQQHQTRTQSANSNSSYLPSPSPSITASYRSLPIPKNADGLIYFLEEPPNSPSIYSSSGSTIREKTRYSQFFNPSYHSSVYDGDSEFGGSSSNKKKKKRFGSFQRTGGERSSGGKKSVGLIARLIKNIKSRFAAP